jgi:hypothetical protein
VTLAGERERIEVRLTVAERSKRQALPKIKLGGEVIFAARFELKAPNS